MNNKSKMPSALQWTWQRCAAVMLCVVCTLLFFPSGCSTKSSEEMNSGADFFYGENGKNEYFKITKNKVIIKTKSAEESEVLINQSTFISAYNVGFWVFATIDPLKTQLEDLLKKEFIVDATYGLEYADGTIQYPSDVIFVKCKEGIFIENILESNGLSINVEEINIIDVISEIYEITLNVRLSDILLICRLLYESNMCTFAEPSFFREMKITL